MLGLFPKRPPWRNSDMRFNERTMLVCGSMLVQLMTVMIMASVVPAVAGPEPPGRTDPVLSNGGVTPTSGDPKNDTFGFYVTYYDADGDWPNNLTVIVDDQFYSMSNMTWSGSDMVFSYYSFNFGSGTHQFYFQVYDDYFNRTFRYPSTGTLSFTVDAGYNKPQLFNWSISNSEPEVDEVIEFSVWYKDQDGSPLKNAYLLIEYSDKVTLVPSGTDYKNGVLLKCNWTVPYRNHWGYYFYANDTTRLFSMTPFSYFNVPDHPPELYDPGLTPKTGDARNTTFTFSIWYKDIDGDFYYSNPAMVINHNDGYYNNYIELYAYWDEEEDIKTGLNFSGSLSLYTGTHEYYFKVYHRTYTNWSYEWTETRFPETGFLTMTAGGNYNPPVLYNASVTPKEGNASTEFTFRVWYKDENGDPPSYVRIEDYGMGLQNGNTSMTIKGTDYKNGVLCELKSTVRNPGNHYVYFYGHDRTGLEAYSQTNDTNITVMGTPGLTSLSNGHVSPRVSEKYREVQFFVDYTDKTGDWPQEYYVVVNGERYGLWDSYWLENNTRRFYNWWNPMYYSNTSGYTGTFKYHFEFIDSQLYPLRYPETGELYFDVFDHIPDLYNPSITPKEGNDLTEFEFRINYTDWKGNDPTSVQMIMDGDPYSMEIGPKINTGYGNYSNETYRACKKKMVLPPGEHNYHFKATIQGGAYNIYPYEGELRLTVDGHSSLYGTDVDPKVAYTDTALNFTVTFRDTSGMDPDYVQVFIDNDVHDMAIVGGNTLTGTQYFFKTMLSKGNHTYYFLAENDHGTLRDPGKGQYHTLTVLEPHPPMLLDALVSPGAGNVSTEFNFSCTYRDLDGDYPENMVVYIDGASFEMEAGNGTDIKTGVRYHYSTKLSIGTHAYFFETEDVTGRSGRLPVKDTYTLKVTGEDGGTIIEKKAPIANIAITYSGSKVTFSGKGSTDPDGNITFFSWVIDGQLYSEVQISIEFDLIGYYKATLTVVDNDGLSDTTSTGFWAFSEDADPLSDITDVGASIYIDGNGNGKVLMNETGFKVTVEGTEEGSVSLHVESPDPDPKVVVFEVSKELLEVSEDGSVVVEVDGIKVKMASSLEEVLTANGSEPLFYLIDTGGSYKVFLYLPDPTDVDVEVSSSEPERSQSVPMVSIVIILLMIIVLALIIVISLLFMRWRGMMGSYGDEKGLNNDHTDDEERPIVAAPSPWNYGLGSQLSPYLDDLLADGRDLPERHNLDRIGSRLRKRMEGGDLSEEDFRRYISVLERIREE